MGLSVNEANLHFVQTDDLIHSLDVVTDNRSEFGMEKSCHRTWILGIWLPFTSSPRSQRSPASITEAPRLSNHGAELAPILSERPTEVFINILGFIGVFI